MSEIITARNTVDRSVGKYERRFVEHPVLGKYLEEVPEGTKPFKSLDELVSQHASTYGYEIEDTDPLTEEEE